MLIREALCGSSPGNPLQLYFMDDLGESVGSGETGIAALYTSQHPSIRYAVTEATLNECCMMRREGPHLP